MVLGSHRASVTLPLQIGVTATACKRPVGDAWINTRRHPLDWLSRVVAAGGSGSFTSGGNVLQPRCKLLDRVAGSRIRESRKTIVAEQVVPQTASLSGYAADGLWTTAVIDTGRSPKPLLATKILSISRPSLFSFTHAPPGVARTWSAGDEMERMSEPSRREVCDIQRPVMNKRSFSASPPPSEWPVA